ncbi:MAG: hypothetical protein ACFHWZ_12150 [Phycisphaerales bacterium]
MAVEPSELPAIGDTAPLTDRLPEIGITVDAGRPLIRRVPTPQGEAWTTFFEFTSPVDTGDGASPIAEPLAGLTGVVSWAMPINIDQDIATEAGATVRPLYQVADSDDVWAEAEWLRFRYAFEQAPLGAITMRTNPTPSESRDDLDGPWTIAATAERPLPPDSGAEPGDTQRIVLVSASGWFQDPFLFAQLSVDGARSRASRRTLNSSMPDCSGSPDATNSSPAQRASAMSHASATCLRVSAPPSAGR